MKTKENITLSLSRASPSQRAKALPFLFPQLQKTYP